jgi:hypothetical protein
MFRDSVAGMARSKRDKSAKRTVREAAEHRPPDRTSFDELAAKIRAMTPGVRKPTPSEVLLRESRDDR